MEYRAPGTANLRAARPGVMPLAAKTGEGDASRYMHRAFAAGITRFDAAENDPVPLTSVTQGFRALHRHPGAAPPRHRRNHRRGTRR